MHPIPRPPVIIVGAGIAGLILGHALKKKSIPFAIFERDTAANSRLQGWALTIHFSLPELLSMLEEDIIRRIDEVQVNPGIRIDQSDSVFINLADCSVKWRLPPGSGTRKRVSRDRFRQLLIDGVKDHISWDKKLVSFEPRHLGVTANFHDGSSFSGLILVGVDGAASKVRSLLFEPSVLSPTPIPVSFLGTSLNINHTHIAPLLEIDSVLFQGCHPTTTTWMWFSVMESPEVNGSISLPLEQRFWKVQLCLSWLSADNRSEIPSSDTERVQKMREKSTTFDPRLRALFHEALSLDHTPILSIHLADWHLPIEVTKNHHACVTLAGDAAHTMAMYRGEGFNHSIIDVYNLTKVLQRIYDPTVSENQLEHLRQAAISDYETELRARGMAAVSMCREACMEVHHWQTLDSNSTVRKKRIL